MFSETLLAQEASILDKNISYKAKNITLHKALTEIGSIVGYDFSYNSDLIPGNSNIKVSSNEVSLSSLLNNILQDSSLIYKVLDKQIVITKRNQLNKLMFIQPDGKSINHINIRGKILDHESKINLSFAIISVKGKSIGTVSNEQGVFNLNISKSLFSDTLLFSYIGYKNTYIP
ncbi:MAG: carboxypeptidase-like regulatory domain-containing protein, partial [Bacteroidales bacterium]|nr:carboxypeptidase-like regulatory domain-containing protein [Bacteroidales bacterium]